MTSNWAQAKENTLWDVFTEFSASSAPIDLAPSQFSSANQIKSSQRWTKK
jgi:hypothetical protein